MKIPIKKLTEEHHAKIRGVIQESLTLARRTDRVNRKEAEKAYREFYRAHSLKEPDNIIWTEGPKEALKFLKKVSNYDNSSIINGNFGPWELHWIQFFIFARDEIGVEFKENEKLEAFFNCALHGHIFFPFNEMAIAVDRPHTVSLDKEGRLHNLEGPALAYHDGFEIYTVQGVRLNKDIVMNPSSLTVKQVKSEKNAEIRRALLLVYGLPRYLRDTKAKLLDSTEIESLYQSDEGKFMVCTDGSTGRIYSLEVPSEVNSVAEAQTALYGIPAKNMLKRS